MNKTEDDWNQEVVETVHSGRDKNIPSTVMVGTYMGCVVAVAKADGATLEDMITLLKMNWDT